MRQSINNYTAFVGKEFMENMRTKKFFVLVCILMFFAIFSALMARYSVEIMEYIMSMEEQTIIIEIPPPVWTDSYGQLYSSLSEMGIIVIIIMFMSIVLREKTSGTIDLMFTKGLSPYTFVFSKYTVAAILTLVALLIAVFVSYFYTLVLFEYGGDVVNVIQGAMVFGLFVIMVIALTLLCSSIASSTAIGAVLSFMAYLFIGLFNFIPVVGQFMPGNLRGHSVPLTMGESGEHVAIHIITATVVIALSLFVSAQVLQRRKG